MDEPRAPGADDVAVRMRAKWRAQRRQEEQEALRLRWRRRSLAEVVHEVLRRGDKITGAWCADAG